MRIIFTSSYLLLLFIIGWNTNGCAQTDSLRNSSIKKIGKHYRTTGYKVGLNYSTPINPNIQLGIMQYNYQSFDNAGVNPMLAWGPSIEIEGGYDFDNATPILSPRIYYEYYMMFGVYLGGRIGLGYKTDFANNVLIASPQIGLSIPTNRFSLRGNKNIFYGIDIPFYGSGFNIVHKLALHINIAH